MNFDDYTYTPDLKPDTVAFVMWRYLGCDIQEFTCVHCVTRMGTADFRARQIAAERMPRHLAAYCLVCGAAWNNGRWNGYYRG